MLSNNYKEHLWVAPFSKTLWMQTETLFQKWRENQIKGQKKTEMKQTISFDNFFFTFSGTTVLVYLFKILYSRANVVLPPLLSLQELDNIVAICPPPLIYAH